MLRVRGTFTGKAVRLAQWVATCSVLAVSLAAAQTGGPLTWPQKFAVAGPEVKAFGFPVTRPGPVTVDVQAQGPPIVVTLQGPAEPLQQQGSGALHFAYVATPQDVQRSVFWAVRVKLIQPSSQPVSGTINVQHPAVDDAQLQRAASAVATQSQAARAQAQAAAKQNAAQFAAQTNAVLQQQRAQLEQQRAQRHAALMAQSQPMIDRLRAPAPGGMVSRGVDNGTDGAASQVTTRGLPAPGMVKMVPASLAIKSLSVTQGEPDDPVMISGTAFGSAAGEVHFVIAPNMDLPQKNVVWTDAQIFASVPQPTSGVPAFNGTVYVKRADGVVSNLMPFAFIPLTERRIISIPPARADAIFPRYPGDNLDGSLVSMGVWRDNFCNWFWNPSGDDQLFPNTFLKNGWTVYAPPTLYATYSGGFGGGAYLGGSRVGTNSPYADVHWWVDLCSDYGYSIVMYIQGPQGTSDGVVVP
jgi:hypothetical protein